MKRFGLGLLMFALCFMLRGQPTTLADAAAWQPLSGPTGGSVAALAMSPNYANDRTVFAGLRGQGVYRTIDGGETWHPSGLSDQVIVDLAISPAYAIDHTIFAAAGLSPAGFNIYRSTDGGATWPVQNITACQVAPPSSLSSSCPGRPELPPGPVAGPCTTTASDEVVNPRSAQPMPPSGYVLTVVQA